MSDQNLKVPSQIFRWFEKMKGNYEQTVQAVLDRFETHTHHQQERLDNANAEHLRDLKQQHQSQLSDKDQHIKQLSQEIAYYKKQINQQQNAIEQLNTRYDAVMSCLLAEKRKDIDIKDIFSDELITSSEDIIESEQENIDEEELSAETENTDSEYNDPDDSKPSAEEIYQQAVECRQNEDQEQAFSLFEQASLQGHAKAMGAMGRAYFLAEGCEENHVFGLAWLIEAAKHELPQAIKRVEYFQENDPELYHDALIINEALTK